MRGNRQANHSRGAGTISGRRIADRGSGEFADGMPARWPAVPETAKGGGLSLSGALPFRRNPALAQGLGSPLRLQLEEMGSDVALCRLTQPRVGL